MSHVEPPEQAILDLGTRLAEAELRGDVVFLDQRLAADFVGIGPRGLMRTRSEWLARFASGDLTYTSNVWGDLTVRVYENSAVMTGLQVTAGRDQERPIQGRFRVTWIFVKPDETWQLARSHQSPVADEL